MLEEVLVLLEAIGARVASRGTPEAGSRLAAIDRIWAVAPPSETVRSLTVSSIQHLGVLTHLIRLPDLPPPAPVYSLLRVALASVCRSLWIVLPRDVQTVQARALAQTVSSYRRERDYHLAERDRAHVNVRAHTRTLDRLESHLEALKQVVAQLPNTPSGEFAMVEAVAVEIGTDAGLDIRAMYQHTSSSVHGYDWGVHVRPGVTKVARDPARGLVGYRSDLDVAHVVGEVHLLTGLLRMVDKQVDQWGSEPYPR